MNKPVLILEQIEVLRDLQRETNENILGELLVIFESNTPALIGKIETAAQTKDFRSLSAHAHKLKSTALGLGLGQMSELCLFLEIESNKHATLDYTTFVSQLQSQYHEGLQELRKVEAA